MKPRVIEKCRVQGYQYCSSRKSVSSHSRHIVREPGDLKGKYGANQIWLEVKPPDGEAFDVNLYNWFRDRGESTIWSHIESVCGGLVGKNIKLEVDGQNGYILGIYEPVAKPQGSSAAEPSPD